jgi:hypothetical protein
VVIKKSLYYIPFSLTFVIMALTDGNFSHLLPLTYKRTVSEWLEEDCPSFDYGGFVVGDKVSEARLLGKSAVRSSFYMGDVQSM